jgi:ABC-type amino acid transport substrate-binding protein
MKLKRFAFFFVFFTMLAAACSSEAPVGGETESQPAENIEENQEEGGAPAEPPANIPRLLEPRDSDFDEMIERRVIRVLVTQSKTHFFLDRGRQRGIVADALLQLEEALNKELDLGTRKLHLAAIPVNRNDLIPFLEQGRGDVAAAGLTITPGKATTHRPSSPRSRSSSRTTSRPAWSPPCCCGTRRATKTHFIC